MLTALKTRFDDSEAGSLYRYTRGWVDYGNPAKAYRELIYLFGAFADLCNQHAIEYWLDWGSLLGFLRHNGGIIPWDYDHDVAMRTEEYERFINIIERLQAEAAAATAASASASPSSSSSSTAVATATAAVNSSCTFRLSDFTFERKGASGYYVMSLVSHPEIQIDICQYKTVNDASTRGEDTLRHCMDEETYEGFFYPDYPMDMIFPLLRVNMLGQSTLIPADSDAVTKLHFGDNYRQVLWVPYVLTLLYNPFLTRTLWLPPVRQVPILSNYIEAFHKHGANSPFLVRNPESFSHITLESLIQYASTCTKEVFGYDAAGEIVENLPISKLVKEWAEDRLELKVLDSPLPCCTLPEDFVALDQELPSSEPVSARQPDAGLGLMLTRANAYTFLHLDPPHFGGGWMYLVSGRKSWTYISPEFIDELYDPTTKRLLDLPVSELTTRFGYKLHNKVFHVTAQAGDLVYFPPAWMHRVRTYEKTIGISGYMKHEKAHANIAKYSKKLEGMGLSSVWNGNPDI